ncbi:MAG: FAD:protein FMN transferase [Planctomycetota bacterium]|nr:FAD:protein FMN transferase [Planctomycetota bacterium]
MCNRSAWVCAALTTLLVAVAHGEEIRQSATQIVMGVEAKVTVYAGDEHMATRAIEAAFKELVLCDESLSNVLEWSEVRQVTHKWSDWVDLSDPLWSALFESVRVARATDGAFDPTCAPLNALWKESRTSCALPRSDSMACALESVGWNRIELDPATRRVRCVDPRVTIEFGAIGKGLAAHRAALRAHEAGAVASLVTVAGDIRAQGHPPAANGWRIQIEDGIPGDDPTIVLCDASVSTSGDLEQYSMIDGIRFSHILDPRTGFALRQPTAATVVGSNGAAVDALATALCVIGPISAAASPTALKGCACRVTRIDETGVVQWTSSNWASLTEAQR